MRIYYGEKTSETKAAHSVIKPAIMTVVYLFSQFPNSFILNFSFTP